MPFKAVISKQSQLMTTNEQISTPRSIEVFSLKRAFTSKLLSRFQKLFELMKKIYFEKHKLNEKNT